MRAMTLSRDKWQREAAKLKKTLTVREEKIMKLRSELTGAKQAFAAMTETLAEKIAEEEKDVRKFRGGGKCNAKRNEKRWLARAQDFFDEHYEKEPREKVIRALHALLPAVETPPERRVRMIKEVKSRPPQSLTLFPGLSFHPHASNLLLQVLGTLSDGEGERWQRSVKDLLKALSASTVRTLLPAEFVECEAVAVRKDFSEKIEAFWGNGRCLNLKTRNYISRRGWQRMRLLLASSFDAETGEFEREEIGGAPVPKLKSYYSIRNLIGELAVEKNGMVTGHDGLEVHVDLIKQVKADVAFSVPTPSLSPSCTDRSHSRNEMIIVPELHTRFQVKTRNYVICPATKQVTTAEGQLVNLQLKIDAANHHKGMQQTAISFTLVNGSVCPNAPQNCRQFCLYEGDDHWLALKEYAQLSIDAFNRLRKCSVCGHPQVPTH